MDGQKKKVKIKYMKEGTANTKYGEKVTLNIQVSGKNGDYWLNGFKNKTNATWKVGDEVEVLVSQRNYKGKVYYDYRVISQAVTREEFDDLKKRVEYLENMPSANKVKEAFDGEFVEDDDNVPF